MFEIKMTNISKEYCLYIDDEEKTLFYSDLKLSGSYKEVLSNGNHQIRIRKKQSLTSQKKSILSYWLAALVGLYDENSISAIHSNEAIDIIIDINIQNESSFMIFDAYTNSVKKCSERYVIVKKEICEEKEKTKNVWRFIKIPIMILGAITFIPIFLLSCFLMFSSFDVPSTLLFVASSFLLFLYILYICRGIFHKK